MKTKTFWGAWQRLGMTLLVAVMMMTATAAERYNGRDGDWDYSYDPNSNVTTLIAYHGSDTNVTTPETIGGHAVTAIGMGCFKDLYVASVTISEGVTSIGRFAFDDCYYLAHVSLPNSLEIIEENAFKKCEKLKDITIPVSVTTIGPYTFVESGLTTLWYKGSKAQWNNVMVDWTAFHHLQVTIHWSCTATFDMQGHGSAPAAQTVYSGVANVLTAPAETPTAQGYDFGGWYSNAACTSAFNFAAALSDNVTIYAKWTARTDNVVTFDIGGKGTAIDSQTLTSGQTVVEPAMQFINENGKDYGIEGWYTDAGCTEAYDFATAVDHSFTLYAKWAEAGHYSLTANAGGTVTLCDEKGREQADGLLLPGIYRLTVTPSDGYSFEMTYTLTIRGGMSESPQTFKGNTTITRTLDLTTKDADITVTFSTNPIVSVAVSTDGTAAAGSYTMQDGHDKTFTDGSTVTAYGDMPTKADEITLSITKGDGVGCAVTIVNNGLKEQYTNNLSSYGFTPKGNVSIELFFYDTTTGVIGLANNADNSTALTAADGKKRMVTLSGRTLYRDGDWNTLCLPFDFDITGSGLDKTGVTLMELDTETENEGHMTGLDGSTLYLNFKSAGTQIKAGKPYIIKWTKPAKYNDNPSKYDIGDPLFGAVTINGTAPTEVTSADGKVSFIGIYDPEPLTAGDKSTLYLGSANKLYWPADGSSVTLNACRAYFQLGATNASELSNISLNFEEEGQTSSLRPLTISPEGERTEAFPREGLDGVWYDLSGRKLSSKPTQKGVYIVNGKKVVIK